MTILTMVVDALILGQYVYGTHVDVVGDGGLDAVLLDLPPPLLDVLLQQVQLTRVLLSHSAHGEPFIST